ncbi:NAD-dependent epimerase/dehydratase family protein [Bacillus suaedae]|uniref:NAD(P)-dependent oxidoreductase n=1 Tax=Halalkalibacter suaedae TaxID=2822140 RepID=A0A940WN77_9BACI|nr:NAD(P)-dependent oxidoreductase [Bacillus suaedae]MBP3949564.1 NAD(P)-dependent oxidoreductase [Bacillus suaedae]
MKRALVTGGLGFIGFHLCERLLSEGIEVIVIDKIESDGREKEQEEKWLQIGRNALLTVHDSKIEDVDLEELVKDVDVVYHLAASTKSDSKLKLAEAIENNVHITKKVVEQCSKQTKIIYVSSVEVYGERPGKISETTPTNPTSAYGITKLAGENIVIKTCNEKKLPYIILRLPTVYGPWQRPDMTIQQILEGNNNPVKDRSTVDLLFVDDCVEGLVLAGQSTEKDDIIHLASGNENEWYNAVKLLDCQHFFLKAEYIQAHLTSDKAFNKLQFQARTSIEDGLAKQREHMKQWQKQQELE